MNAGGPPGQGRGGFEDMQRRVPDLSKIRALVGYEPQVHLDQILDHVIEYFGSDKARL